jgi:hypothetical protein
MQAQGTTPGAEKEDLRLVLAMSKEDIRRPLANGIALMTGTGDRVPLQLRAILRGEGN